MINYGQYTIGPSQVSMDITYRCNLRCIHCYNSSGENMIIDKELDDSKIIGFIKSLIKMNIYNFCFCGGEPLLRKGLVFECIKILSAKGISTSLVTNGTLADDDTIDQLYKYGLKTLQISLDGCKGSHDKLRNKKGVYDNVINAIEKAASYDLDLSVAFTPCTFNYKEFVDVYYLLVDIKEKHKKEQIKLRTQPLMLMGRAVDNNIEMDSKQQREFVMILNEIKMKDKRVYIEYGDPIDHIFRFRNNDYTVPTCHILSNGDIVVSPYIPLVIGNILKHSLSEYWQCGLYNVWQYKVVSILADMICSVKDMKNISNKTFNGDNIVIDLIENDLNDSSIINGLYAPKI